MPRSTRTLQTGAVARPAPVRRPAVRRSRATAALTLQRATGNRAAVRVLARWAKYVDPERQDVVAPAVAALQRTTGQRVIRRRARDSRVASLSRGSRAANRTLARKFIARGSTADFAAMVNGILGVQNEIRVDASGEVTVHATNVQGPPTRDAIELLSTIRTVIGDAKTTSIDFIHGATSVRAGDSDVIVGNYDLARIDLDDVAQFGFVSSHSEMGDNAAVQLIHEITEQYRKQVHGEDFGPAHQAGHRAQERLLGATLVQESGMTPIPGGTLGEVTTTYRYPSGREVDVITRLDFATGNIVSVRRVVRNPARVP